MKSRLDGKGLRRKLKLDFATAATLSFSYRRVLDGADPLAIVTCRRATPAW